MCNVDALGDCFPRNVGRAWDWSDVTAMIGLPYMAKGRDVRGGEGSWSGDFEFIEREMIPGGPGLIRCLIKET